MYIPIYSPGYAQSNGFTRLRIGKYALAVVRSVGLQVVGQIDRLQLTAVRIFGIDFFNVAIIVVVIVVEVVVVDRAFAVHQK